MTTFPIRPLPLPVDGPSPGSPNLEALRMNPLEWARRRRESKETRRLEAAGARAGRRLENLGAEWHVIEWPHSVKPITADPAAARRASNEADHAGFLAIGPGGIFAVSVADHGSKKVLISGDVVQISGRRPALVAAARKDARRASKALSAAVGLTIPVVPVLALVGRGLITVYGLPKDCIVTSYRELDHVLSAGGRRISAVTAEKLSEVARSPWTWVNEPYQPYTWYPEGSSASQG
jgi:hypothetical protein